MTAYEMRISDWSSDVCSSDLLGVPQTLLRGVARLGAVAAPPRPEPARRPARRGAHRRDRAAADGPARPRADGHLRRDLVRARACRGPPDAEDRKSTRLNSSH